jgi:hypothetical protein
MDTGMERELPPPQQSREQDLMLRKILCRFFTPARSPSRESPVPWIDDAVWTAWSQHPTLEAESPIVRPTIGEVSADDRERAGRRPVRPGERSPPEGTLDAHTQLLASTPAAAGVVYSPLWPVCCRRLTTMISCEGAGQSLVSIENAAGNLDHAFIESLVASASEDGATAVNYRRQHGYSQELRLMRHDQHGGDGFVIFECRSCGRTYLSTCEA